MHTWPGYNWFTLDKLPSLLNYTPTAPSFGQQRDCNVSRQRSPTPKAELWKVTHLMKGFPERHQKSQLNSSPGVTARTETMGRWAASLCITCLKSCPLQASFGLRVWTTAWAGWGRIRTSPFTSEAAQHQTGFSCWGGCKTLKKKKKKFKKSAGVWTGTGEASV